MVDYEKILGRLENVNWRPPVFVVAFSFLLASIASIVLSYRFIPDVPMDQKVSITDSSHPEHMVSLNENDMQIICDRNVFNDEKDLCGENQGTETETDAEAAKKLVKSDLPLEVVGIIYGGTPFNGLATIMNTQKDRRVNSFIVGDVLVKEALIVEIHRWRVIIERQGRREYLELERKDIVRSTRLGKKKTAADTPNAIAPIATGPAAKAYQEEGFDRQEGEIKMSTDFKEKLLGVDFTKVLQDAKATPATGPNGGFVLTRIRVGSIYEKSGLQNDDIILEINGVPLKNAASAISLLKSLRNETEIDMIVERAGSQFPMTITVQ